MSTYRQLKQQIGALEKKAAIAMKEEARKVVEGIKEQIAEFGLTAADLGLKIARRAGAGTAKTRKRVLTPKYRDPITGKTWNGNGKRPGWIVAAQNRGRLDELLIAKRGPAKARASAKPPGKKAQAAPVARPAAKKASKKRAAAPKRAAPKPSARRVGAPAGKPPTAPQPAAPAATDSAATAA